MLIQRVYNINNSIKPSNKNMRNPNFGLKPGSGAAFVDEKTIALMPRRIQEFIKMQIGEKPAVVQESVQKNVKPKAARTVEKLIKGIRTKMASIERDLQTLEKLGISKSSVEDKSAASVLKAEVNPIESLGSVLEYKSKYYKTFMQVLDSNQCEAEHCKEIIANVKRIRKDHRSDVLIKMVDYSQKTKDNDTFRRVLDYCWSSRDEDYSINKRSSMPVISKELRMKIYNVALKNLYDGQWQMAVELNKRNLSNEEFKALKTMVKEKNLVLYSCLEL